VTDYVSLLERIEDKLKGMDDHACNASPLVGWALEWLGHWQEWERKKGSAEYSSWPVVDGLARALGLEPAEREKK
jgi:hypothetical protein